VVCAATVAASCGAYSIGPCGTWADTAIIGATDSDKPHLM